ncbi:MAG: hypothetical protein RL131_37, partial [Bacteroidota bacterium]
MKACLFLLSLVLGFQTIAQQYDPAKISRKAKSLYEKALVQADEGQFTQSLESIEKILIEYPSYLDALLTKAGLLGQLKN